MSQGGTIGDEYLLTQTFNCHILNYDEITKKMTEWN